MQGRDGGVARARRDKPSYVAAVLVVRPDVDGGCTAAVTTRAVATASFVDAGVAILARRVWRREADVDGDAREHPLVPFRLGRPEREGRPEAYDDGFACNAARRAVDARLDRPPQRVEATRQHRQ